MKFDTTNKVIIESMNEAEARAFVLFLISEKKRHLTDIEQADILICKVIAMFELEAWYNEFKKNIT